jgi:ABC-type lipoprotein export system ATPase subunit
MFEGPYSAHERKRRAEELLAQVGLDGKGRSRPPQLSGGERQRVAIARALANDPALLLADEPTGRLDSVSGQRILDLLEQLQKGRGLTIVLVTHEPAIAQRADRIVEMLDGRIHLAAEAHLDRSAVA